MMGPQHALFAGALYTPLVATNHAPWWGIPIAVAAGGLADLDQAHSTISQAIPWPIDDLFRAIARPGHRDLNTLGWAAGFAAVLGLLAGVGAYAAVKWLQLDYDPTGTARHVALFTALAVLVGYLSHIVGDWVFDGGKPLHPHTNGTLELYVARPAFCMAIAATVLWATTGWRTSR